MPCGDVYVTCPFYKLSSKKTKRIKCDWIVEGAELNLRFKDPKDFVIQMETFCQNRYKNCEIYKMLSQAYEEEPSE